MISETGAATERRTGTRDMIDKLLEERQEMFALYWQVAGLDPSTANDPATEHLQEFCEVLVDYIAFGHFEVYDRISRGEERRGEVIKLAEEIYPRILETTDLAVAFNDKYDESDHELHVERLTNDLSELGEELANRVDLEDQLISVLLHR